MLQVLNNAYEDNIRQINMLRADNVRILETIVSEYNEFRSSANTTTNTNTTANSNENTTANSNTQVQTLNQIMQAFTRSIVANSNTNGARVQYYTSTTPLPSLSRVGGIDLLPR